MREDSVAAAVDLHLAEKAFAGEQLPGDVPLAFQIGVCRRVLHPREFTADTQPILRNFWQRRVRRDRQ